MLEAEGAEVVCAHVSDAFSGVGAFYQDFRQLTDAEVVAILSAQRDKADAAARRD